MEYYYADRNKIDVEKKIIVVDDFEFKHLVKVLRKKEGDKITLTDGERNIYQCEISDIHKSNLICKIINTEFNLNEPEVKLSLFISPLRNPSRFEFAVEKAVELGVYSITPVITEFTINKNLFSRQKLNRLKKIIVGAMGQSQRCFMPDLKNAISYDELLYTTKNEKNKVVMYESSNDNLKFEFKNEKSKVSLLIGPEGGFSKNEIDRLVKNNWLVKSLGERKFRAETAAIISISNLLNLK